VTWREGSLSVADWAAAVGAAGTDTGGTDTGGTDKGGTDTGGTAATDPAGPSGSLMTVSQAWPALRPTTIRGTMMTEVPPTGSKENEPKATGPVPGMLTVSSTSKRSHRVDHQRWVRLKRSSPRTSRRAVTPQATSPSPSRTHARGPSGGRRSSNPWGSAISRVVTVSREEEGEVGRAVGDEVGSAPRLLAGAGVDTGSA